MPDSANGHRPSEKVRVAATATAVPPYVVGREQVKIYLQRVFDLDDARLRGMLAIVDNAGVEKRHSIFPVDYTIQPRPLTQTTLEYKEHAIRLGTQAARECLDRTEISPREVDLIVTVSCTGYIIPSLDAYLIQQFGFRPDVRRLPITELGCVAGAMALSRAREFVRAFPGSTVLLIAVELPSLTFQRRDISQANLISSILFGDGAAAAVITGRCAAQDAAQSPAPRGHRNGRGPLLLDSQSHFLPNSLDAMGFDLRDSGFHMVLSKDVPQLLRDNIRKMSGDFLARRSLARKDVSAFLLHPGGLKILQYLEEELSLNREETQPSWDVLREYGNLSSASVLFVLHEWLTKRSVPPGTYGLMAAFGPGLSVEQLLLRWE